MSRGRDGVCCERGAVTLWMLGLSLLLLMLGGLSLDLWHVVAERRALVGAADAAAYAAASGLDEATVRRTGTLRLDPRRARRLAAVTLARAADADPTGWDVRVAPDGGTVTVRVVGEVPTALLGLLAPSFDRLQITAEAVAGPRRG